MDEQILQAARDEAASDATCRTPLDQLTKQVEGALRDHGPSGLEAVKAPLRKAREPRMRTCSYYLCDKCNQPILDVDSGYIIHGNVYVADPECRGGLIGNNFPRDARPGAKIEVTDVQENVFCRQCLIAILKLAEPSPKPVSKQAAKGAGWRKSSSIRGVDDHDDEVMRQLREMDH